MREKYNIGEMICYKDQQLLVINKLPGLAVQSQTNISLEKLAQAYAKKNLHLIHRIDQVASGIVLFAKNKKAAAFLSKSLKETKVLRTYLACCPPGPLPKKGLLKDFLIFDRHKKKAEIVNSDFPKAKNCELQYQLIHTSDNYQLVEIKLLSGRTHQIRAQLSHAGMPIKGDVKYGSRRSNKNRSIHLHSYKMEFIHPTSNKLFSIVADPPDDNLWNYFKDYL